MKVTTVRDIAARIRNRRRDLGWTQALLAEKVSVGREWVIRCEQGKTTIEWGLVLRTLRELGLSLEISTLQPQDSLANNELDQIVSSKTKRTEEP